VDSEDPKLGMRQLLRVWRCVLHRLRTRGRGNVVPRASAARKPDLQRALARELAVLTLPDCGGVRLTVPTLSPMTGRHTHELEQVILLSHALGIRDVSLFCRRKTSTP